VGRPSSPKSRAPPWGGRAWGREGKVLASASLFSASPPSPRGSRPPHPRLCPRCVL
jgi:hypothetical protein